MIIELYFFHFYEQVKSIQSKVRYVGERKLVSKFKMVFCPEYGWLISIQMTRSGKHSPIFKMTLLELTLFLLYNKSLVVSNPIQTARSLWMMKISTTDFFFLSLKGIAECWLNWLVSKTELDYWMINYCLWFLEFPYVIRSSFPNDSEELWSDQSVKIN